MRLIASLVFALIIILFLNDPYPIAPLDDRGRLIASSGSYSQNSVEEVARIVDKIEELKELEIRANADDPDAQLELGINLKSEFSPRRDIELSNKWLKRAYFGFTKLAEQNDTNAQFKLGLMYDFGNGVAVDSKKAIYWYQKAGEGGNEKASFHLGWLYQGGRPDVTPNPELSLAWYEHAAELGSTDGMNLAGKISIEKGQYVAAYKWFVLAERNGKSLIGGVNALPFVSKMTSQQIQDAKRQADEWQARHQKGK